MASSFNAFGTYRQKFGGNIPVWLGVVSPLPGGGALDSAYVRKGAYYPAGMPINFANGVIKPFVAWVVKSVDTDNNTITVYGNGMLPVVNMMLMCVGSALSTKGAAEKVSSFVVDGNDVKITLASDKLNGVSVGATLAESSATSAATSGAGLAVTPNAYLYNDIYLGDIDENAGASGAVVIAHAEGLRIDLTVGRGIKALLGAAIPQVILVNA